MTLRIERYGTSRYWAIYDGPELVVVTLYKRGAQEVLRRLAAQPPAAAQAAAVEAAVPQAQELAAQARRPPAPPPGVFPARRLLEDAARWARSRRARVPCARHPQGVALTA